MDCPHGAPSWQLVDFSHSHLAYSLQGRLPLSPTSGQNRMTLIASTIRSPGYTASTDLQTALTKERLERLPACFSTQEQDFFFLGTGFF